jgi:hypothetical protein
MTKPTRDDCPSSHPGQPVKTSLETTDLLYHKNGTVRQLGPDETEHVAALAKSSATVARASLDGNEDWPPPVALNAVEMLSLRIVDLTEDATVDVIDLTEHATVAV